MARSGACSLIASLSMFAGEPKTRVAKVSGVPPSTSKEFLSVLFARAFHIKRESDQSEAEEAKKAKEAAENDGAKAESNTAEKKEEKDDEDKEENLSLIHI